MFHIEYELASDEFTACWASAGQHLKSNIEFGQKRFIRSSLMPILLDHLGAPIGTSPRLQLVCILFLSAWPHEPARQ